MYVTIEMTNKNRMTKTFFFFCKIKTRHRYVAFTFVFKMTLVGIQIYHIVVIMHALPVRNRVTQFYIYKNFITIDYSL